MKWISDLIELIFPRHCIVCGEVLSKNEEDLCLNCLIALPLIEKEQNEELEKTFRGIIQVEKAASYLHYHKGSPYNRLLHLLKYKNRPDVGVRLAIMAGNELKEKDFFKDVDLIIPLPLSKKKQRMRGYNQCDYIAQGLSQVSGIPVDTSCITRTRANETQTHKTREERWKNVEGIFAVDNPQKLAGKHILLVDDVLTTGATIASCASAIIKCGGKVSIFTIAHSDNTHR